MPKTEYKIQRSEKIKTGSFSFPPCINISARGDFLRRTGRVILIFILIVGCMMGMWIFQSWREARQKQQESTLYNVYVTDASGTSIQVLHDGNEQSLQMASAITGQSVTGVADLHIKEDKVVRIVKKPEEVKGKILKITEESINLAEYGDVVLDSNFVVYKMDQSGKVSQGKASDLMIGADGVRFVAVQQRLCAAVIPAGSVKNIRVILQNNDGNSYDMGSVVISADTGYTIVQGERTSHHEKSEKLNLTPDNVTERMTITADQGGRLTIESLKRSQGMPAYRGNLEIDRAGNALHIINELPLEEYLYSVVPSEMPTEYAEEALKAQAVCARSYAMQQMQSHRLAEYGAHVDDSVSFQVYNNLREDEKAIAAVNATKDQVVVYNGKVATTYFYSTSCGSSAGTKDVWYTKKNIKYLPSRLLDQERAKCDLSSEEGFIAFMKEKPQTVDSDSGWYRWEATISSESLQKSVERSLEARYKVNPTQIQVRAEDGSFASRPVRTVGKIQNILVKKRGKSGIISMIEIQGSEATVQVYTEYNVRALLIGDNTKFKRQDKKEVSGLSILPSGFFYIEKKGESYVFHGGGYGHGVGMSQNGANTMAKQNQTYVDILTFYFPGTTVQSQEVLG